MLNRQEAERCWSLYSPCAIRENPYLGSAGRAGQPLTRRPYPDGAAAVAAKSDSCCAVPVMTKAYQRTRTGLVVVRRSADQADGRPTGVDRCVAGAAVCLPRCVALKWYTFAWLSTIDSAADRARNPDINKQEFGFNLVGTICSAVVQWTAYSQRPQSSIAF